MQKFLFMLLSLVLLGPLGIDLYLPTIPAIAVGLGSSEALIQSTISLFILVLGLGQVIAGPLVDNYGRKPVALAGIILYMIGAAMAALATSPTIFIASRLLQGVAVCCTAVVAFSGVRDRLNGDDAARAFGFLNGTLNIIPALAPLLGAWLLNHASWRAIFAALLAITALLLLPTLLLKERAKTQPSADAPKNGVSFWQLLRSPVFSGNVAMYAACSAGFFAWLTGSPFILGDMGYSPSDIGLSYVPQTLAFLLGGYGCRAALKRINGKTLLPWLLVAYGVSMVALYLVATLTDPTLTTLLIPFCVMALVNGAGYPIMVANALMPFPESSGKAAALQNTLQLGLCFVASMLVSAFIAQPLLATVTVMVSTVILAALGYFLQRGKAADAQQKPQREHANSAS
ncbi:purine nucleoside transporter PunC [Serratia marcescens]|nr:purine nucleoside transporter PunC [Serratia marcescens]